MPKDKKPASTGLQWFQKPLSIKQSEGLPEKIAAFLEKYTGAKPTTAKELLLSLLETAETAINIEVHQEAINNKERFILELETAIDGLQAEKQAQKQETERLLSENQAQKQETERLLAENTKFTDPQTLYQQWFESLQQIAPHLFNPADQTPLDTLKRILFVEKEKTKEFTALAEQNETLAQQLFAAQHKTFEPKANQAIIEFTRPQLDNIRLVAEVLSKMGYTFRSKRLQEVEPEEVIHAAIAAYLESSRVMAGLAQNYSPLTGLLL